jgi:hypothetical protein
MSAGKIQVSLKNPSPFFFTTIILVVVTYLADNIVDTLSEGENFYQAFSPLRLSLLLLLILAALCLLRVVLRHVALQSLHLAAME